MSKTPEEMAEEHANNSGELEDTYVWRADKDSFLAGYQAANKLYAAKLKEANDTIDGMVDECEGLKTIIYDNEQTNLPTSAKWISVKDRLPEEGQDVLVWYHGSYDVTYLQKVKPVKLQPPQFNNVEMFEWCFYDFEDVDVTYWHPLPAPPKEEV